MIGRRTFLGGLLAGVALPASARLMVNQLLGFGGGGGVVSIPLATVTNKTESLSETNGTIAQSHTVDAGTNCLVVIGRLSTTTSNAPVSSISTITFGAASLTQRTTQTTPDTADHLGIWTLENPTAGSATITVTETGNSESKSFTAINFSGVDTSTPVGSTAGTAADTGTDHTYSGSPSGIGGMWVCGDCSHGGDTDPFTPASGVTTISDGDTGSGSDHGYWAGYRKATTGSVTLGATASASDGYAAAAIELLPG